MISLDEARAQIFSTLAPLTEEQVPLSEAAGRILAGDIVASMSQPPFAASAMDGYAVRFADLADGRPLRVPGESAAGAGYPEVLKSGEAVRIFTGAPAPREADHVVIQEDTERKGDFVHITTAQTSPENIRAEGVDFRSGDRLLEKGALLSGPQLALAAAANFPALPVRKRPSVAVIANGNELVLPGAALAQDQIISSIPYGLLPLIETWGGQAEFKGIAADEVDDIRRLIALSRNCDLIIPIGGASVGDKDLMHAAFAAEGCESIFRKIAVKPGKPAWFGRLGHSHVIGLPGNPASALTIAFLLVELALARLLDRAETSDLPLVTAKLDSPLSPNGSRETFLRGKLVRGSDGQLHVNPFANQDSSLLSVFARADALIRRIPQAPVVSSGEEVQVYSLR